MTLKKAYDPKVSEKKLQNFWKDKGVYKFDRKSKKKPFVIDTPPPYPSGEFHIGNALNWCYFDFAARFKRMRGYNVLFPQGFDVHGLPTEVKVEQKFNVKSSNVSRKKWKEMCEDWTNENIVKIKQMMSLFGFSIDWSTEYKTSDESYIKMVQRSFLDLREKGLLYRGKHPINWCVKDETAIADAEVDYTERDTKLNSILFKLSGEGEIVIATTRPEFLHACVAIAVNPEDERYKEIIGRRAIVPIFGQEVEIFASGDVEPKFGTGIVMICTFGDKQDVAWVLKKKLPIIDSIDEGGRLVKAGKFSGMKIEEARKAIIEELKAQGALLEQKPLKQNVGICWRCKHTIEIVNKEQWFVAAMKMKKEVIEETKKVRWIPDHMKLRQISWASSMDWDWVVSRQKVYGTPIPVWYCRKCGEIIFAEERELPVDPTEKSKKCDKCGAAAEGETDTLDTWMDSSLTIAYHAGWPEKFNRGLYPATIQPNGTDIIRTWDYYLMLRHLAIFSHAPYKTALINGMVMGEDGKKMSKSLGNYVVAREALEKSSADAIRFWSAISGSTGNDIPFSWKEVYHGQKFINKLWNVFRFCYPHIKDIKKIRRTKLRPTDEWILSCLQKALQKVTESLEGYQFNIALMEAENFVWHELADNYIEMVKYRLYNKKDKSREAAIFTLYSCLLESLKIMAPFLPFVTEEIYQSFFRKQVRTTSIHLSPWPNPTKRFSSKKAEGSGDLAKAIISTLRQFKSSRKLPLNTEIKELKIEPKLKKQIMPFEDDLKGTMNVKKIVYGEGDVEVPGINAKIGVSI